VIKSLYVVRLKVFRSLTHSFYWAMTASKIWFLVLADW